MPLLLVKAEDIEKHAKRFRHGLAGLWKQAL